MEKLQRCQNVGRREGGRERGNHRQRTGQSNTQVALTHQQRYGCGGKMDNNQNEPKPHKEMDDKRSTDQNMGKKQ